MKKKILGFLLTLTMVAAVVINPMTSNASKVVDISRYRSIKGHTAPTDIAPSDDVVFAGWYTDATYTTPIAEDRLDGTAVPKWVNANVLTVKYQFTNGLTVNDSETALRLVTTVDSLDYKQVGFVLNNGIQDSVPAMSNTVYEQLLGGGKTYDPNTTFCSDSHYFAVFTIVAMPNSEFTTNLTVTPQWETLDGTMVKGKTSDAFSVGSTLRENITRNNADGSTTVYNYSGANEVEYLPKATYMDGSTVSFDCKVTPVQNSYTVQVYGATSNTKYFEQAFNGAGGKVSFDMQFSEAVRVIITYYDDADWSKNVATFSDYASDNPDYPSVLSGGAWDIAGHVQGATTDDEKNYLYMSFNDRLVKVDMHNGEIVASMTGLTGGHLGDLTYYNGKVYGSLEFSAINQVYVAVIDVSQLTEMNMDYKTPGLMTAMYVHENEKHIKDDIFGARGIDGIAFGTLPGDNSGKMYLIVACGLGIDEICAYNNYQILMVFDPADFKGAAIDISDNLHKIGPEISRKFYVYTGYTWYGVQNLEYDVDTGDYWLCCYPGEKEGFPDYTVFVVDGDVAPETKKLELEHNPNNVDIHGEVVTLKEVGLYHEATGIWGIRSIPYTGTTGFVSLGNDYFYIGTSGTTDTGLKTGYAILCRLDRQTYVFEKADLLGADGTITLKNPANQRQVAYYPDTVYEAGEHITFNVKIPSLSYFTVHVYGRTSGTVYVAQGYNSKADVSFKMTANERIWILLTYYSPDANIPDGQYDYRQTVATISQIHAEKDTGTTQTYYIGTTSTNTGNASDRLFTGVIYNATAGKNLKGSFDLEFSAQPNAGGQILVIIDGVHIQTLSYTADGGKQTINFGPIPAARNTGGKIQLYIDYVSDDVARTVKISNLQVTEY